MARRMSYKLHILKLLSAVRVSDRSIEAERPKMKVTGHQSALVRDTCNLKRVHIHIHVYLLTSRSTIIVSMNKNII